MHMHRYNKLLLSIALSYMLIVFASSLEFGEWRRLSQIKCYDIAYV